MAPKHVKEFNNTIHLHKISYQESLFDLISSEIEKFKKKSEVKVNEDIIKENLKLSIGCIELLENEQKTFFERTTNTQYLGSFKGSHKNDIKQILLGFNTNENTEEFNKAHNALTKLVQSLVKVDEQKEEQKEAFKKLSEEYRIEKEQLKKFMSKNELDIEGANIIFKSLKDEQRTLNFMILQRVFDKKTFTLSSGTIGNHYDNGTWLSGRQLAIFFSNIENLMNINNAINCLIKTHKPDSSVTSTTTKEQIDEIKEALNYFNTHYDTLKVEALNDFIIFPNTPNRDICLKRMFKIILEVHKKAKEKNIEVVGTSNWIESLKEELSNGKWKNLEEIGFFAEAARVLALLKGTRGEEDIQKKGDIRRVSIGTPFLYSKSINVNSGECDIIIEYQNPKSNSISYLQFEEIKSSIRGMEDAFNKGKPSQMTKLVAFAKKSSQEGEIPMEVNGWIVDDKVANEVKRAKVDGCEIKIRHALRIY